MDILLVSIFSFIGGMAVGGAAVAIWTACNLPDDAFSGDDQPWL